MSWIKEINELLRQKVNSAVDALLPEERDAFRSGCGVIAFDGLLRGGLPREAYAERFRRCGGDFL